MKPIMIKRICVDVAMTVVLLFLMAYELVGQATHEWLGITMFVLFVIHHVINGKWCGSILKGRYTPLRVWQTLLVALVLLSMLGSMVSGIILSRHLFTFLPISGGRAFARSLHMIAAYWGFVWMSLHLGLHWNMMTGMAGRLFQKPSAARTWALRALALAIAAYGVYAFVKREVGSYMLLRIQFVFFDFEEPLVFFLLDYMAVMGLFVFLGHYFAGLLRRRGRGRKRL
ncbi:MAG: DUF4405 domain-containing protein [Eubacteriales bacterium]|nr:DUF4405 domain-containing protein [Eubacteriales bacterium]